jgi:hypothetical protein
MAMKRKHLKHSVSPDFAVLRQEVKCLRRLDKLLEWMDRVDEEAARQPKRLPVEEERTALPDARE